MKRFCLDTSGVSNPLVTMPFDLFEVIWVQIFELVEEGAFAVTTEIHEELMLLEGEVGECFKRNRARLVREVGEASWDWSTYVGHARRLQLDFEAHISERLGGKSGTVGLTDLSIVALARTLSPPVISMERMVLETSQTFRRTIPNLCQSEGIEHLDFNAFLRRAGIRAGR